MHKKSKIKKWFKSKQIEKDIFTKWIKSNFIKGDSLDTSNFIINYNYDYIEMRYTLMEVFLFQADKNVLDISYNKIDNLLNIQIVLLDGTELDPKKIEHLKNSFPKYDINIKEIYLTLNQYNESKGDWISKKYKWLDNILFSKMEVK